ncbi:pre-peptidase C-terminal domain-containing protein [Egbenema bharatensis]|uniref:pre-peptidase C-terminal domain-containing protein n=1 Tax=Egbenema bharatensis TaxID=3463334 RepID=UPI003A88A35F
MASFFNQVQPLKGAFSQLRSSARHASFDGFTDSGSGRSSSQFNQARSALRLRRSATQALTGLSVRSVAASTANSTTPIGTPRVFNSPTFSVSDRVDRTNPTDFYRFTANQSGVFTANLTGLTGDADVKLIQDRNNNGQIDQGEVLAWQWERGTRNESIRRFLSPGTYFVKVVSYNNQAANYSLASNFAAATQDNRRFSIQLNFGQGLQNLNAAARNAITESARFWEQVITHSSFDRPQTLTVNVQGTFRNDSVLAFAGPTQVSATSANRRLPTSGSATINTRYSTQYNNTPSFLRDTMVHELGHVLGIGTLWESVGQNLIDRGSITYRANSNAGWAYGELLGTFNQTAIPVEPNVFGHWDEGRFRAELMTPIAEAPGNPTPLSQLTIASLRDLGWNVNYGAATPYALTQPSTSTRTISRIGSSPTPIAAATSPSATSIDSSLPVRCGCSMHLAASGLNTLNSTHLSELIG